MLTKGETTMRETQHVRSGEQGRVKVVLIVILCAVALAAGFVYRTFRDAGEFKTLAPHSDI